MALLGLAVGCGTEPDPIRVPEGAAVVNPLAFAEAEAAMRVYTGFTQRHREVIRTDAEWRETWGKVTVDDGLHLFGLLDAVRIFPLTVLTARCRRAALMLCAGLAAVPIAAAKAARSSSRQTSVISRLESAAS